MTESVGISVRAKHELEMFCAHNGVTMSGVVTQLVLDYTDSRNPAHGTEVNSLLIKLAALAVHAEELLGSDGHEVDKGAIEGLLADLEVRAFLDDPNNAVLLPLKRRIA
jgi:hypothetical protein